MSNSIDTLIPKIVSRGLLSLREKAIMPRLVNASFSADAAKKGDRIDIPVPQKMSVQDVVPSHTLPAPPDSQISTVSVPLDNWKKTSFCLTDQEMNQIDASQNFMPMQMQEAISALADAVNLSVMDAAISSHHFIGTPNITPFAAEPSSSPEVHHGVRAAIKARKLLNEHHAPKSGRFGVLDYDAEANALGLPQFADANRSGSTDISMEGEIGRKFGIDWFAVDNVPKSASSTVNIPVRRAASANSSILTINVENTPVRIGTIFSPSNASGDFYAVTEIQNNSGLDDKITVAPPLKRSVTGSHSLSLPANMASNLVMHKDAIALVMRPLLTAGLYHDAAGQMMSVTDPETGISLRLEVSRQYKQTVWELDILWGVKLVRPDWCIRILG